MTLILVPFRPDPRIFPKQDRQEHGFWQRRLWEPTVRNEKVFEALCDYIRYNPVMHRYAEYPHGRPYSSFDQ